MVSAKKQHRNIILAITIFNICVLVGSPSSTLPNCVPNSNRRREPRVRQRPWSRKRATVPARSRYAVPTSSGSRPRPGAR